ncbi:MAG: TonB-dependent receptor [Bryobacteraceae bacterium]|nr:TonB-dependent receptor [Bryobacteraceae bacterium]
MRTCAGSALGFILAMPVLLLVLATAPEPAVAQVLYGSITGTVTDPSDAPVPQATVTITNLETGQVRTIKSNQDGAYQFPTVPSGTYRVHVAMEGFHAATRENVVVTINSVARADLRLQVGSVTETISINAQAPDLQTDRAEVRTEIGSKALRELPVPPGRNYQSLFRTIPGFTPPANAHSVPSNPSRSLQYNVNGASSSSNDVRVDGASQFNVWLPHVTAYVPSLEGIETVNVVTNNFDAEQGLAGGSAVNVQIKSGTNDLHGSLFEFHNNNNTKARPWALPLDRDKPKWVFNQFGGTLGGPIIKNKLFYFGSYEGTTDRQFAFRILTVPTAEIKAGNMAASANPIYDPATGGPTGLGREQFAGNVIPQSRISPIARKLADLTPLPNLPGLTNNYFAGAPYQFDRHTGDGKVNWNITDNLTAYARVSILNYDMFNPEAFGAIGGPGISNAGGNPGAGFGGTYSTTVAATWVISPSFILDGNFGYTLMDTNVEQGRLDENVGLDFLGIPGTNGPRRFEGGVPRFSVSSYANLGIDNNFMPYYRNDPQYHYVANANWTKGTHNLRFGFDIARQDMNHTQPEFPGASHGAQGGFSFGGGPTQLRRPNGTTTGSNQYNSYASFLLGYANNVGRILQVPDTYTTRTGQYSLYIRDQWNITRKLSLSYGTRWEYFPMPTRADRGMEVYDFANNKVLVCGVGNVAEDCGVKISKASFAPRFGFAYRASDTFVIRGGYGITNDPYNLARPHRTNHPVLLAQNIGAADGLGWAGTLAEGIPPLPAPDLGNGIIDIPDSVGFNSVRNEVKRGYIQSWNFTLEKQLGAGFVGQAGYVATRQTKQLGYFDWNAGQVIGAGRNGQPYFQQFGRFARTAAVEPVGSSKYDSLQVEVRRRWANGLQFRSSYTFSKALGVCGITNSDNNPCIQYLPALELNRSVQSFDRTHNFQTDFLAELPFGRGKRWAQQGLASKLLGGWQINGLLSAYSGTPFTVSSNGGALNLPGSSQRADLVGKVRKLGGVGRGEAYYDWTSFQQVTEPRFGTAGFNILRGPELINLDLGVFRRFSVTERVTIQFRAEAFNATNTPHFNNPSNNISNVQFFPDGSFRGGVFEVTGVNGVGREGIDERVFRFGVRIGF